MVLNFKHVKIVTNIDTCHQETSKIPIYGERTSVKN